MRVIPAQITKVETLKDRTAKVHVCTSELRPEDWAFLGEHLNSFGYMAWKGEQYSEEELKAVDSLKTELGGKTQSERIRNVLYILYEQDKEGFSTFDNYYQAKTEKVIEHFKSKIL